MGDHVDTIPPLRLFLTWADRDRRLKEAFVPAFQDALHLCERPFSWWEFEHLTNGDAFDPEIRARLDEADYGIALLSPAYFASTYIRETEVPALLQEPAGGGSKPHRFVGIALRDFGQFAPGRGEMYGIKRQWVFYQEGKAFDQCRDRNAFAQLATTALIHRIERDYGRTSAYRPL